MTIVSVLLSRFDNFEREVKSTVDSNGNNNNREPEVNCLDLARLSQEQQQPHSIVNIRCSTFVDELPDLFRSAAYADTVVRCADGGARRVHSLVLAAASSLLRTALTDAAERNGGEVADYLILVPDIGMTELESLLCPLYGDLLDSEDNIDQGCQSRFLHCDRDMFGVDFNRGNGWLTTVKTEAKERLQPLASFGGVCSDDGGASRTDVTKPLKTLATTVGDGVSGAIRRKRSGRKRKKRAGGAYSGDFIHDAEDEENCNPDLESPVNDQKGLLKGSVASRIMKYR